MTTQLGAFNSIWSAVVDDANQVIFYLMDAEGPTDQLVSVYASAMSIADHEYRSPWSSGQQSIMSIATTKQWVLQWMMYVSSPLILQ